MSSGNSCSDSSKPTRMGPSPVRLTHPLTLLSSHTFFHYSSQLSLFLRIAVHAMIVEIKLAEDRSSLRFNQDARTEGFQKEKNERTNK